MGRSGFDQNLLEMVDRNVGFLNNLFGSIAGGLPFSTDKDFVPAGFDGEKIDLKATWLGMRSTIVQKATYDFCFPVASVVDTLSDLDLNGCIEVLRLKGKGKNDYATSPWAREVNKLFTQPNPKQSWKVFRHEQNIYKRVFGYAIVFAPKPVGYDLPAYMQNLEPWRITNYTDISKMGLYGISDYNPTLYYHSYDGVLYTLNWDDLIILPDTAIKDERTLLPQSKLVGLDMAVSNLCAAMEADNVLLKKKGPLGFISNDPGSKDNMSGYLPMAKAMKKMLQSDLGQYGLSLSQWQYVITRAAAKWNPMSFDVKQLGTKETVVASEKAICHRFRLPYVLYEVTDSTFANADEAHEMAYEDAVIPAATKDIEIYAKKFEAEKNLATITIDYSHLGVLQEDKKDAGDARLSLNNAYEKEWLNDLITRNMWLTALGYDTIEGGDVYYSQWIKQNQNGNTQENTTA